MSRNFDITLSAKDKFTATFNKLEKTAGRTNRALGAGEKTSDRSAKNTDVWAKSMERVTRAAASSVSALRDAASPLEAMGALRFGGVVGGVVALAAGAALLSEKWASQTTEMARTSKAFGIGTSEMQLWSAVAKAAGYDGDAMARSMAGLAEKMYLVRKNLPEGQLAKQLFEMHGVDSNGTVGEAMQKLLAATASYPEGETRSRFAGLVGMDENTARLAADSKIKINDLIREQIRLGAIQSKSAIDQASAQVVALSNLENAWKRMFNTIGAAASPSLTWLLNKVSEGNGLPGAEEAATATRKLFGKRGPKDAGGGGGSWGAGGGGGSWEDTPEWQKSGTTLGNRNPALLDEQDRAELEKEIGRTIDPQRRAVLESARGNPAVLPSTPIQFDVTIHGATPGTTATAKMGGQMLPVRISHSMPTGRTP